MNYNNYKDLNDYELVSLAQENNEDAINLLHEKYLPLIQKKSTRTFNNIKNKGIELSDIIQECTIGFTESINNFSEEDDVTFYTFTNICMDRQLASVMRKLNREKHKFLNDAIPLENINENGINLIDYIKDDKDNPELNLLKEEDYQELTNKILSKLTPQEKSVLKLKQDNLSYKEISKELNLSEKSIDNTLQRIRNKVKSILTK